MSFTRGLHRAAQQNPAGIATVFGRRRQTFAQLEQRVGRLAAMLLQLGVAAGDSVAMLGVNSDRYLEYFLAAPWMGAIINPLNYRWSAREIVYSLLDSNAVVLFVDDQFAPLIEAIRPQCPALREVIFCGDGVCPQGVIDLEPRLQGAEPSVDTERRASDLYGIFYTGGTTGTPKGVMLSHSNICSSAMALMAEGLFAEGAIGLHAAPMFHLADMMVSACLLLRGGTHVMLPMFQPEAALLAISQHRITDLLLVPAMIQALVDCPGLPAYDTTSIRHLLYGAAPISEALLDRAMAAFPKVEFIQGYGMTEVAAVATILPAAQHDPSLRLTGRLRSAGRAAVHARVRIVDAQDRELPRNEVGEIVVRGPNVMSGYLNDIEATRSAVRKGWLHSGDLGFMDGEGYVYIVDRLKDMIISGGENVYSAEVENVIAKHPAVAACAVIGIPSPERGELVHAVVVLRPGAELTQEALYLHCKEWVAGYKCPRSLEIRAGLPLSGAGKVLKAELRKPFWNATLRAIN
jgi:long-chain acyl-CoA synthetase